MKKVILPLLFLHLAIMVNAATYYFSNDSGNDFRNANSAQNPATPWRSLWKLNSIMYLLKPGDQVLFKRGETFWGSIIMNASGSADAPITFGAYGNGENPVITGFTPVSNWTRIRDNVWEATFIPATPVLNTVIMNDELQGIGRWPNANESNGGYLNIDSHAGQNQITNSELSNYWWWTGGDVVIRKNRWVLDRSTILYQAGTSMGFGTTSTYPISDNFGFFIENNTWTLDKDGEWFYNKWRNKLQMYFSSNQPAENIKASNVETLVTINFRNYITFSNLSFTGANSYAFDLTNSNNITIDNCTINFTGIDGVRALSSAYFTFKNSTVSNTNNNALNLYWYCNNALITDNTFQNTGTRAGMGQSSAFAYQAIFIVGNNNLIQYNNVLNTGYDGIHIEGDYDVVKNNFVNNFCYVLDDGGGIYTGQGLGDNTVYNSKTIQDNIIINGLSAPNGTSNHSYLPTQGIYLDDNTNHVTVTGNTTANCAEAGIFNHNATYTNITNNTMYNNGEEQFLGVRVTNPASNVTLTGNIMFAKTATQFASRIESYSGSNNIGELGTVDNNYYSRPIDNNYMFYDMYLSGGQYYTSYQNLESWRAKYGFDKNSQGSPITIPAFSYSGKSDQNLFTNGSFDHNASDVNSFSSQNNLNVSWNSDKLDGGSVQISSGNYSPTNSFMLTLPTEQTVAEGKNYILSFTVQGAAGNSTPMDIYLRKEDAPNDDMTPRIKFPIRNYRQDVKVAFTANATAKAAIELDVASPNGAIWIDNVTLQEADVQYTNPDDYIVFEYNAGTNSKTVSLPGGTYYDATGKAYSDNVELQPYTSIVLTKDLGQSLIANSTDAKMQDISLQGNLKNTSSTSTAGTANTNLSWDVKNQQTAATSYEVERSADATNFATIGNSSVKTSLDASVTYQFNDAQPAGGKNYYRIKQKNAKGAATYSKVIMVNNISFKVNPNPAYDVIHILFDQPVNVEDHLNKEIVITNPSGTIRKAFPLTVTDNMKQADFNVSLLQPGLYMLSITADGQTFSKTFLKQ